MLNWYDIVVAAALFYGVWSGIHAGLTGEIIRVAGLVLMIVLASEFHEPVGDWLRMNFSVSAETAQLVGFVGIALVVYLITLVIRLRTRQRMQELKVAVLLENVGGGFAGMIRMVVIMAWVTVVLSLSTSGFLADQVGMNSRFGSLVLDRFPAFRVAISHGGFLPNRRQQPEQSREESGPTNTQHSETVTQ